VDGTPIRVADVERTARATGLGARGAAERLIELELLYGEARRRGLEASAGEAPARQLAVQLLLEDEVERPTAPERIDPEAVEAAYRAAPARFDVPERRAVWHVLARASEGDPDAVRGVARRIAVEALGAIANGGTLATLRARFHDVERDGVTTIVEEIPPFPADARFVRPFLDAVYRVRAPGPLPAPVETEFGFHAVVVSEILPARTISLREADPELRRELSAERREMRFRTWTDTLAERYPVERREDVVDRVLATLPLDVPGDDR
jgi:hypothetical protein